MARHHAQIAEAGGRVVGICVDSPERNAAMVEKLELPYSILSDPDGEGAIKPYGVWHEGKDIARPAIVIVAPDGSEAFREVSGDFADRLVEDDLVEELSKLGLDPVAEEHPAVADAEPGDSAMPVKAMSPYFKGAKFAAKALAIRAEDTADAERLEAQMDRYIEAVGALDK